MITGSPVNVLDYGADPTGITNSSVVINEALSTGRSIYIPAGTYRIDSALLPKTSQMIYGDGVNVSVLKAHTAGMTVLSYPSGAYSNVNLSHFSVDGNSLALIGINIISASQGSSSSIYLDNVSAGNCVTNALYMSLVTYAAFTNCIFAGGVNTVYFDRMYSSSVTDSVIYDGSNSCLYLFQNSVMLFTKAECFNSSPASPATALAILDDCTSVRFNASNFEAQGANAVTYEVELLGASSTENYFLNCSFMGLPNTKTNCIAVGTAGGSYHTVIQYCRFIKPTLSSILLLNQQGTNVIGCTDLTTYNSTPFIPVTVTSTGGTYFLEQLNGQFITGISAPSISTQSISTPIVNLTATVNLSYGTGSPEGTLIAGIGSLYVNLSGGTSTTLYVKTSGTGNTGWTAK